MGSRYPSGMARDDKADEYVDPVIEAYRPGVDVTLIRANLQLPPTQRLLNLMRVQRFALEVREAGKRMRT